MIEIRDLAFTYGGQRTPVFQGLTWRVGRGERWAVIGPSGSGKSTLLHLIVGLRTPDAGTVLVSGEGVPRKAHRGKTGLVLQEYGLLPWATLRRNVALGLRIRRFYGQATGEAEDAAVEACMRRLGIEALADRYPSQVSGGQRQRAAIARTLVMEPDVLLMDEPFAALDALTREDLERLTLELHAETGTTLVFVTHNIEEAVLLGRRILVLGPPPNGTPGIIENPLSGGLADRAAPEFQAQCRLLRETLRGDA